MQWIMSVLFFSFSCISHHLSFPKGKQSFDVLVCRYCSASRKYTLPLGAWWDQSIFLKSKLGKCLDYDYGMFREEAHTCSSVNSTSIMDCKFLKPGSNVYNFWVRY